jgi:hypothetical protein
VPARFGTGAADVAGAGAGAKDCENTGGRSMLLARAAANSVVFAREALVGQNNSMRIIGCRFLHPDRNGRSRCTAELVTFSIIGTNVKSTCVEANFRHCCLRAVNAMLPAAPR